MSRDKINRVNKALVHWEEVADEVVQIQEEYKASGWDTIVLHPGDVTVGTVSDGSPGFRLVIPESEFEALDDLIGEADDTFDSFEVYNAPTEDLTFYVVALKSPALERIIFLPVFYNPEKDAEITDSLDNEHPISIECKKIGSDNKFVFKIEDTGIFT